MRISRRAALALMPLAGLTGCGLITTTTTNGVTTITVNVKQLDAWGQAFANAASLIGVLPGIAGTPAGVAILGISALAAGDIAAIDKSANGALVLTFDATSIPAAVSSLLTDGSTLLTDSSNALPSVASGAVSVAQTYIAALKTVVSLLTAALTPPASGPVVAAAMPRPMTEAAALKTLRVTQ
ncbi:MAG: hypothetical protein KGL39_50205 [Patescibacteria group bacterium]|nr:hypothetical protein [Patescibacteria group bacterium]